MHFSIFDLFNLNTLYSNYIFMSFVGLTSVTIAHCSLSFHIFFVDVFVLNYVIIFFLIEHTSYILFCNE